MTPEERELTLRWIECWKQAGPELERIRRKAIREADTKAFVRATSGMVLHLLRSLPARERSGLVEQQALFRNGRC